MVRLTIATIVLLSLIGSAQMQNQGESSSGGGSGFGLGEQSGQLGQGGQSGQLGQSGQGGQGGQSGQGGQGGQGRLGGLGGMNPLGQMGSGLNGQGGPLGGLLGQLGGQQNGGGMFGGLMNQRQPMQQQQQCLADLLRQLPQRTAEIVQQLLTGVRNILPNGLGRQGGPLPLMNGGGAAGGMMNGQNRLNMPNPFSNMNMNGGNSSPLNQLTQPLNDLRNGRLPDIGSMTQGLTNSLSNLMPNNNGGGRMPGGGNPPSN